MGGVARFSKGVLGALVALLVMAGPALAELSASGVTFSGDDAGTRFALELSGEPEPRIFVVDQPPRLVVDLDEVDFDIAEPIAPAGRTVGLEGSTIPIA